MLISPAEPPAIRAIGQSSPVPERFGADMFFVGAHGKIVGIQRKEFGDFVASVHGDRLAREVHQMQRCHVAIIIIEGKPAWTRDGNLADRYHRITKPQFRRLLASIQARGIWVFQTDSIEDTIVTVLDLQAWFAKDKHTALTSRPGAPSSSAWGSASNRDWQVWLLQGLPGIGPEIANKILDACNGVPFKWRISKEELAAVPGMGPKRVRAVWQALLSPQEIAAEEAEPKVVKRGRKHRDAT